MPIRIKPYYDLKTCVLDLTSIEEITRIISRSFREAKFSANKGTLQIYDEPRDSFIKYISKYDFIESFSANGLGSIDGSILDLRMTFDEEHARVSFDASLEHENWIEHFIIDLNKQLRKPRLGQKIWIFLNTEYSLTPNFWNVSYRKVRPYCRIILKQKPSSPLAENIKANILSNIIWVILGMIILYLIQWIYHISGFNLNIWGTN